MGAGADVGEWATGLARRSGDPGAAADTLAGIGEALGVAWDGPGDPAGSEVGDLPAVPGWLILDAAREALLDRDQRRRLGAHHTPPDLARRVASLALDGLGPDVVVADPACGGGAFLVAAADLLVAGGASPAAVVGSQLVGRDLDPLAVATTRAALRCWARAQNVDGDVAPVGISAGDGLAGDWSGDAVIGNPPFLSPLGTATGGGPKATAMRQALGAPYVDVSGLFLLRSLDQVRAGGRVVLIQPESLLTSRDAAPVRAAAAPHLEGLWVAGEPVFSSAVRVCAPVLRRGTAATSVTRWRGAAVRPAGRAARPAAATWSSLRPSTAPRPKASPRDTGTVGDLATATAGFRDQFYGLAAAVTDGGRGQPLITSGLIDPGGVAWSARPARIGGRTYAAPTVDPHRLENRLRAWVEARSVPKVLVATQTRVLEAAPDHEGRLIPMTPVLAVTPRDPGDVLRLAAALTSPAVTAWALREFGGAGLSADALKLAATQVLRAPLPADAAAWVKGTAALADGDVDGCGTALAGDDERLLRWWRSRLPRR